jgi:hypothetical protein
VADDVTEVAVALSRLSARHRVAFVAAAVQRAAPGFTEQIRWRRTDREFFAATVAFLWDVAAGADPAGTPARLARLEEFREMRAKRESSGRRFFAEQAVFQVGYALDAVGGDPDGVTNVLKCALHLMDGFDQDLGESGADDREVRTWREVLKGLVEAPELTAARVTAIREQAVRDAGWTRAAVRRR